MSCRIPYLIFATLVLIPLYWMASFRALPLSVSNRQEAASRDSPSNSLSSCAGFLRSIPIHAHATADDALYNQTHFHLINGRRPLRPPKSSLSFDSAMKIVYGSNIYECPGLQDVWDFFNITNELVVSPADASSFINPIIHQYRPNFILEVGVFLGKTSIDMATTLDEVDASSSAFVFIT